MTHAADAPIRLEGVNHFYGRGALRKQILHGVSVELRAGEIVIVTGPSGSGKTTMLTLVGALRSAQEGSVRVLGEELRGASARTLEKVRWVKEAAAKAGRDVAALEWNALVFVAAVTDDPKALREALGKNGGMSVAQVAACPLYLTGSAREIQDELARRREAFGISYVVIQGHDEKALATFAEQIVAPLAGK